MLATLHDWDVLQECKTEAASSVDTDDLSRPSLISRAGRGEYDLPGRIFVVYLTCRTAASKPSLFSMEIASEAAFGPALDIRKTARLTSSRA
jgi:hypothetical protein